MADDDLISMVIVVSLVNHNHNNVHNLNHDDGDENDEHDGNYDAGSSASCECFRNLGHDYFKT